MLPRWPEAMATAARAMTDATGCTMGEALAVLLALVTGTRGPDQPERARAVEYLIRTMP
jgi:hypothetical protein